MKLLGTACIAAFIQSATSHYVFVKLIANGTIFPEWQYIRKFDPVVKNETAGQGLYGPYVDPMYNYTSPDLRCGRGAFRKGAETETATILAGTQVGFQVGLPGFRNDTRTELVGHPGPGSVWLSEAEGTLEDYQGQGPWVKIAEVTARDPEKRKALPASPKELDWALYAEHTWNFTIPVTMPPGDYLLRVEHIYPLSKGPQWFVNCAHVQIVGDGGGIPGPTVQIPGVYVAGQPDVFFDSRASTFNISTYEPPAPPVWAS